MSTRVRRINLRDLGKFCEGIKVPERKTSRRKDVRATYDTRTCSYVLHRTTILRLFDVYTKVREHSKGVECTYNLRKTYDRNSLRLTYDHVREQTPEANHVYVLK